MARFTQWTVFVTSGKSFPEVRQAAIDFLNRAQNSSPPEGGDQTLHGLFPSGSVYQNLFALVQGVQIAPMPDGSAGEDTITMGDGVMMITPTDPTRMVDQISGLNYLATVLSDTATAAFTSVPLGVGYLADFQTFTSKTELANAISEIELKAGPPGQSPEAIDIVQLAVVTEEFRALLANQIAASVSAATDVDLIRAQAVGIALSHLNVQQIYNDAVTTISSLLISGDNDDIISSSNLTFIRSIVSDFETKVAGITTRLEALEAV